MAKLYKVSFFFIIQMSFEFTSSMYHIYRGEMDKFSRSIVNKVPKNAQCGDDGYCSCEYLETFTYGYDKNGHRKGECTSNARFLSESGCEQFLTTEIDPSTGSFKHTEMQIVHQDDSAEPFLEFTSSARGYRCNWKSTNYTISGDYENWMSTGSNPGSIFAQKTSRILQLQINNPSELLSMYPGTLLKLQIECPVGFRRFRKNEICLLLKIEGKTNITANLLWPTTLPPETTTFSNVPATSPTLSTKISTKPVPEVITESKTGFNIKISSKASKILSPTTAIPSISDPERDNQEGNNGDSNSLVPILVPILIACVLIVLFFSIFLYRSRLRSSSASIKKDFHDTPRDISSHHADLKKAPQGSPQSYDTPESLINTTPIYDAVYENTNGSHQSSPSYYEFDDDDYATLGDPRLQEGNQSHVGRISALPTSTNPSTNVYQNNDLAQAPESTEKGNDNLGYLDQSSESPYYHSLEKDISHENIYDRVAEDPQEPFYNVLEKPN